MDDPLDNQYVVCMCVNRLPYQLSFHHTMKHAFCFLNAMCTICFAQLTYVTYWEITKNTWVENTFFTKSYLFKTLLPPPWLSDGLSLKFCLILIMCNPINGNHPTYLFFYPNIPSHPLPGDLVANDFPIGIAAADKHVLDLFLLRRLVHGLGSIICAQVDYSSCQIFSLEVSCKQCLWSPYLLTYW